MRRPLVLVGFTALLTLAAAVYFGEHLSFLLIWVCLAGFAAAFFYWKTRRTAVFPVAFLTAAVALGSFCIYTHFAVDPPRTLDGKDAVAEATVCELPVQQYGRWYYVARVDRLSVPGAPTGFKIRISSQNALSAGPYSRIDAKVHLFLPQGGDGFSSRTYYASHGIMLFAYLYEYDGVKVLPPAEKPPYYYALRVRQKVLDAIDSLLNSEEAALVKGVFLGGDTSLSAQTQADFRTDGVSHILSVSGLHMATVAELLAMLFLFLRFPKKLSSAATGAGVLCFMAVTGFVPSVSRSGMMCVLYLAGPVLSRRADPLNSLCTATLILCLMNPLAAADVGLLLSFSATLGLILLSGRISSALNRRFDRFRLLRPLVRGVNGVIATSVAATLFTLPIIILTFGTVSLVSLFSNLLELVPSSLMIGFAAAAAVFQVLAPQSLVAMPFGLGAGLLAKYMLVSAHWLAGLPLASVSASVGFVKLWLAGTLALLAAALFRQRGNRLLVPAACLSVIVLEIGILSYQAASLDAVRISVLDVGTAESAVISCNGHAAVVGCGGYNSGRITGALLADNVSKLDYAQNLTHDHDESANLADVVERCRPGKLLTDSSGRADGFVQKAVSCSRSAAVLREASSAELWDRVKIETRACGKADAAEITTSGISVLVLPADADAAQLPPEWLSSDLIVCDAPPPGNGANRVCTVFSVDSADLPAAVRKFSGRCVWTGGSGKIVLELKEKGMLSVRRES